MLLHFNKEDGVDRNEDKVEVYPYPNDEDIEDVRLNDERERHWRICF